MQAISKQSDAAVERRIRIIYGTYRTINNIHLKIHPFYSV